MLGVGRSFVTRVIGDMRAQGAVETRRGRIVIKDSSKMHALSCHCAMTVEAHFAKVLGGIYLNPV